MKFDQEQFDYMQDQYLKLTDKEKETLRKGVQSNLGSLIGKVMGPDFVSFLSLMKSPKRGIAAPR